MACKLIKHPYNTFICSLTYIYILLTKTNNWVRNPIYTRNQTIDQQKLVAQVGKHPFSKAGFHISWLLDTSTWSRRSVAVYIWWCWHRASSRTDRSSAAMGVAFHWHTCLLKATSPLQSRVYYIQIREPFNTLYRLHDTDIITLSAALPISGIMFWLDFF